VDGSGSKPICKYDASPASFMLFMFLISIIILFEKIKSVIHHAVPKAYMPVIHAIFAELSTLGFVSLIAFLLNFSFSTEKSLMDKVGYSINLGHELHNMFEHMHWLLFGVTATFLCLSLFLLKVNLSQLRRYESWSDQIEEGVDVLHLSPYVGQHEPALRWMRWTSRRDEMEIFLRIFSRFVDAEAVLSNSEVEVPKDFNLGLYMMKRSSVVISAIIEISPLDWLLLLLLAFVAWISWYVNYGKSSTDGGYVCFWIYDLLLLLLALAVDYKLHNIMLALMPVDPNQQDGVGEEWRTRTSQEGRREEEEEEKKRMTDERNKERIQESAGGKMEVESSTKDMSLLSSQFDGELIRGRRSPGKPATSPAGSPLEGEKGDRGTSEPVQDSTPTSHEVRRSESPNEVSVDQTVVKGSKDLDCEIEIAIDVSGQSFGADEISSLPQLSKSATPTSVALRSLPLSLSMQFLPSSPTSGAPTASNQAKLQSSNRQLSFNLRNILTSTDHNKVIFDEEFSHRKHARFVPKYILQADPKSLKERSKWRKFVGGRVINHHHELFWFDKNGPVFLLRIIRHLLLASVVMIALSLELFREHTLCLHLSRASERRGSGSSETCETTVTGVFLLLISLIPPVATTLLLTNIIRNFVTATSVEYLKSRECIMDVIHEQHHRRTLRLFRLLISIASVIDQIKELKLMSNGTEEEGAKSSRKETEQRSLDLERSRKKSSEKNITGRRSLDSARNERRNLEFVLGPSKSSGKSKSNLDKEQDNRNSFEMESFEGNKERNSLDSKRPTERARNSLDSKRPTERSRFSFETLVRRSLDVARGSFERYPKKTNKIPEHVLKHLKEIFDEADRDESGQLDLEEFRLLLQAIGAYEDEEQTTRLFEMIDIRGDGKISFQEFSEVMARRSARSNPDDIANKIWTVFDPNGKGKVTPETAVEALQRIRPQFDVTQVFYLLWTIDIQRKHHVTKMEFVLFVKRLFEERSFAFQFT